MEWANEGVRSRDACERLLEDSWETRSRGVRARELLTESIAALLFVVAAVPLAVLGTGGQTLDPWLAGLLVLMYAAVTRIEFPVGAGFFVPSYLVLVPMLILLPPALVPLLAALGLVLGAGAQWIAGRSGPERLLFSIPDAWHTIGPALVLVAFAEGKSGAALAVVYVVAFAAACLFDLVSATLREAAAIGVAAPAQARVIARVWLVDASLAPIGLLAAEAAGQGSARVLLIMPLALLLVFLAQDRTARIAQAQRRLEQAFTDPLTGLGNRRLLADDLREQISAATQEKPIALIVLDLNGFKAYNDTFGHGAGDALLARLGGKLASLVKPRGTAYRLGGDEFCALIDARNNQGVSTADAAVEALTERGEHFAVSAAHGMVLCPRETDDPHTAMLLADQRMYAKKRGHSAVERDQAQDVLIQSLDIRHPSANEHSRDVAEMAARVGRRLGMDAEEVDVVTRAAQLHDLGKVGIPDAILSKSGTLDEAEWDLVRQHTILGERILSAAPALRPVARIVRASHERWDGLGYPDGLAGEQIPLSARVVAVCDAYWAMTASRPYSGARSHSDACLELSNEGGHQFDAAVVEAFLMEIDTRYESNEGRPAEPAGVEPDGVTAHLRELLRVRGAAALEHEDAAT